MAADWVLQALRHVWLALQPLNLPMAVMGGLALAAWGRLRTTQDVDLLISTGDTDLSHILQRLSKAGIQPRGQEAINLGHLRLVPLDYEPPGSFLDLKIDLLLAEAPYPLQALARRTPARLPDLELEVQVLACEDLILYKLLAGRIIDRADAAALLRANRSALDMAYLSHWVRELGLGSQLMEVWQEAFPAEDPPPLIGES